MTTDSENFVLVYLKRFDELNKRIYHVCIGLMITIVAIVAIMVGSYFFSSYKAPDVTNTNTNTNTVGGDK